MNKKDTILKVATRLFSEKGFSDTSMSEISKLTGAAEGTIFYHFKSKEALFISILKQFRQDIIEEFEQWKTSTDGNGLDEVEKAITFYIYLAGLMEERFLFLHRHDLYQIAESNPECRKNLEAIYQFFLGILEKAILQGLEDGSIREVSVQKMSMIMFFMMDGMVRFNTYKLYDAGSLYKDVIESCRKILLNESDRSRTNNEDKNFPLPQMDKRVRCPRLKS
jgi:AcrR family transcriptional regulator